MKKVLLGILVIVIVLLIPYLTKDRSSLIKNFPELQLEDFNYSEIAFTNSFDNTSLGGMLFLPEVEDPVPLAIFIHGSGYSDRSNTWYLTLVKHLLDNDIAVLLPDKRGSERSEGDWKGVPIEVLATDTEAAIQFARSLPNNFSKVGIIGMSQGGWIAPVVASGNPIDFVVDVSGTLATAEYQLYFEESHNIANYTYLALAKPMAKQTVKSLKEKPHIAALITFDPLPYWKKVYIPNLILFSADDTNCPVDRSLERVSAENLDHLNIKVFPEGGHAIANDERSDYRVDFLNELINFIKS